MSNISRIFIWKKAPFLRLLIPLVTGIILQFFIHVATSLIVSFAILLIVILVVFSCLPQSKQFHYKPLQGILLSLLLFLFGSYITWHKDIRNHAQWYGHSKGKISIVATIDEPPEDKAKSFKAIANADAVIINKSEQKTEGKFLIYFSKTSKSQNLKYGDRIIVNKPLSPIVNSGNPASIDYRQYCAFRQLYHQVYLRENEWILLPGKNQNTLKSFFFSLRQKVVFLLEKYLGNNNNESSIAKALLIGYKVDLDKDLLQAYSNAGVVHIIAISGLHIGIIYAILFRLFSLLPLTKKSKPLRLFFILTGLWLFVLLTGASSSAVRAGIMFSFIIVGSAFNKTGSVYNSITSSAFLLLCFNPFLLWDVGFELSYLAVIGIVVAQKPISNWLYFHNKLLQKGWQLCAVSLSAQLFTFPLCLYYFHQLPLLFLLSNLVAIPLSTLALLGCLILITISFIPVVAFYFAKVVYATIFLLNYFVLKFDSIPYSLWSGVSISEFETFLLSLIISIIVFAFIRKNKKAFKLGIAFMLWFVSLKTYNGWEFYQQKKIIVYNIPKQKAVEFIDRNHYLFTADSELVNDKLLYNYNIKPVQLAFHLNERAVKLNHFNSKNNFYQFYSSRILMIDSSFFTNYNSPKKIKIDYILISKNPKIKISDIAENFDCNNYIFDASNPSWKIEQWKKECEELHLHFHSVPEQGAFVINL